jgi:hypothetical protein
MPKSDPRIDAYIAKSAEFARPILTRLRRLVHAACPEVTETIKWNVPFYEHQGILLTTPAFKKHCAVIFWKGQVLFKNFPAKENPRTRFRRLTSPADLPGDKILTGYIKQAVKLNAAGGKNPARAKPRPRPPTAVPDYFLAALRKNKKALAAFENFSASCQREYIEWLAGAKREATRAKRLETALAWLAAGK